ncbi:MAG: hypothetical protein Q9180_000200 [Flavoplaca navasiana]
MSTRKKLHQTKLCPTTIRGQFLYRNFQYGCNRAASSVFPEQQREELICKMYKKTDRLRMGCKGRLDVPPLDKIMSLPRQPRADPNLLEHRARGEQNKSDTAMAVALRLPGPDIQYLESQST